MNLIVLMLGAALGLFANLIASAYLDISEYGRTISYINTSIVLAIIMIVGLPQYLIANRRYYKANINGIKSVIFFVNIILIIITLIFVNDNVGYWPYLLFYILNVVIAFKILDYQILENSLLISFHQILPSISRFIGACLLVLTSYSGYSRTKDVFEFGMFLSCILILLLLSFHSRNTISKLLCFNTLGEGAAFIWNRKKSIGYYSLSSFLAIAYSLAIVPLANIFWGDIASGYLGIYLIFWSVVNIFITAFINNKILPTYSVSISDGNFDQQNRSILQGLYFSTITMVLTLLGVWFISFFSELIWIQYKEINRYLFFAAIALALRPISALLGMVANFHGLIKYKFKSQLFTLLIMMVIFMFFDFSNIIDGLIFLLLAVESVLLISYWIIVKDKIINSIKRHSI